MRVRIRLIRPGNREDLALGWLLGCAHPPGRAALDTACLYATRAQHTFARSLASNSPITMKSRSERRTRRALDRDPCGATLHNRGLVDAHPNLLSATRATIRLELGQTGMPVNASLAVGIGPIAVALGASGEYFHRCHGCAPHRNAQLRSPTTRPQ